MKPIQLNKHQIEAILNGASMLCMPTEEGLILNREHYEDYILTDSPLQIGEEYYVQEVFNLNGAKWGIAKPHKINYKIDGESEYGWIQRTRCRPEYSRIKFKVTDIQIKRVGRMLMSDIDKCGLSEEFIEDNFPYENNLYVFLPKLERI